jgi:hypothetical protein
MNDPVTRLRKAALGANTMLPFLAVLFFGQGIRAIGQDIDSYHGASSVAMIVGDCLMFVGLPLSFLRPHFVGLVSWACSAFPCAADGWSLSRLGCSSTSPTGS